MPADQLQAHRRAVYQPRGHRHAGQACQVDCQGVNIFQVHGHRVIGLGAQGEGRPRCGGSGDDVDLLETVHEILLDQAAHLLGLLVIGIVVARRQGIGADQDAALDLIAKALFAGAGVKVVQIRGFSQRWP